MLKIQLFDYTFALGFGVGGWQLAVGGLAVGGFARRNFSEGGLAVAFSMIDDR